MSPFPLFNRNLADTVPVLIFRLLISLLFLHTLPTFPPQVVAFIQQKSEDTPFGSRSSPLTEELSARGAVWDRAVRN